MCPCLRIIVFYEVCGSNVDSMNYSIKRVPFYYINFKIIHLKHPFPIKLTL